MDGCFGGFVVVVVYFSSHTTYVNFYWLLLDGISSFSPLPGKGIHYFHGHILMLLFGECLLFLSMPISFAGLIIILTSRILFIFASVSGQHSAG